MAQRQTKAIPAADSTRPRHAGMRRQGRFVLPIGLLLVLATFAGAITHIYVERTRAVAQAREGVESEAAMLAAHARQTLKAADLVLRSVQERADASSVSSVESLRRVLGTAEVHEMLKDRQSGVPQVSVASIVDLEGDMVNFTRNYPPRSNQGGLINLKERDYFQAHLADPGLEVFLSAPVKNKGTGTWTFYLARKIRSAGGQTLGVVLVGLESEYFRAFYEDIWTRGEITTLLHANGRLLGRWPLDERVQIGTDLSGAAAFKVLAAREESRVFSGGEGHAEAPDGAGLQVVGVRALENYPVVVSVRWDEARVLGNWRRATASTLLLAGVLSLLIVVSTLTVRRLLVQRADVIDELILARTDAERATAAKSEFLANMSHEIRTPMNAVVGLVDVLKGEALAPEARRLVAVIADATDKLLGVVNDVLDFSKLEAGADESAEETFEPRALVDEAMAIARGYATGKPLILSAEVGAEVPARLFGDRGRLARILLNLLNNAIKYTEHGSVALQVERTADSPEFSTLSFTVVDTGRGVPLELQETIFLPFERGVAGKLRPRDGSGLGLAICRQLAMRMGGRLSLQSAPGRGSRFMLALALRKQAPAGAGQAAAASGPAAPAEGLRVLVAEDTPANQLVIRLLLERLGHSVTIVDDGAKALEQVATRAFDVVFMDIQMPVMDGYAAVRAIRQLPPGAGGDPRALPIVGLSAFAQKVDAETALASGMDAYLSKPVKIDDVARILAKVVRSRAGTSRAAAAADGAAPEGRSAAPEPGVDVAALNALVEDIGEEGLAMAVSQFQSDAGELLERLGREADSANADAVKRAAHSLKGLLRQFGVSHLAEVAASLEREPARDAAAQIDVLRQGLPPAMAAVDRAARQSARVL